MNNLTVPLKESSSCGNKFISECVCAPILKCSLMQSHTAFRIQTDGWRALVLASISLNEEVLGTVSSIPFPEALLYVTTERMELIYRAGEKKGIRCLPLSQTF